MKRVFIYFEISLRSIVLKLNQFRGTGVFFSFFRRSKIYHLFEIKKQ